MKILVIGGSGFIGSFLMKQYNCTGTSTTGGGSLVKLDIRDPESVNSLLREIEPELVINASGMTNVDFCETHPDQALEINGEAVKNLSYACSRKGIKFVHISTDYVFDGISGNYVETDSPNPVNEYGKSKVAGESLCNLENDIVLRISTPYGPNLARAKMTFMEFVVSKVGAGQVVRIVKDQITTPTYVGDIPSAIDALIRDGCKGIYHLGSRERLSRYQFACMVAEVFGHDVQYVVSVSTEELHFIAKRPKDSSLNVEKISQHYQIPTIRSSLVRTLNLMREIG